MGEFCVCTRCAMPLIRSNEQGISSTKSDERGMQLQQKQRTASARFYTPIQPDQALKPPIFGRLHVSRSHNVRYTTLTRVQLSSVNAINPSNRLNPQSARRI